MESWPFLTSVLLIAIFDHNSSLIIATVAVMVLKLIPYTVKWLPLIQHKGANWGVTVTSVAILIPIMTRQVGFDDLWAALKTPAGWIAVGMGIAVAILSKHGVNQLAAVPQVTAALILGMIIGVVAFKGIAASPVAASRMTYCVVTLLNSHL